MYFYADKYIFGLSNVLGTVDPMVWIPPFMEHTEQKLLNKQNDSQYGSAVKRTHK